MRNVKDKLLVIQFVEKIIQLSKYELISFKEFLEFINTNGLDTILVKFLSKIAYLKSKFSINEAEEKRLNFYSSGLQ